MKIFSNIILIRICSVIDTFKIMRLGNFHFFNLCVKLCLCHWCDVQRNFLCYRYAVPRKFYKKLHIRIFIRKYIDICPITIDCYQFIVTACHFNFFIFKNKLPIFIFNFCITQKLNIAGHIIQINHFACNAVCQLIHSIILVKQCKQIFLCRFLFAVSFDCHIKCFCYRLDIFRLFHIRIHHSVICLKCRCQCHLRILRRRCHLSHCRINDRVDLRLLYTDDLRLRRLPCNRRPYLFRTCAHTLRQR